MFEMLNEMLFEKKINSEDLNDYLNGLKYEFLNNLESFEELINQIKIYDIYLYNKILKAENVILKLFQAWKENIKEAYWLFAEDTDFFVKATSNYDANPLYFVRTVDGGWFSIDYPNVWMGARLDVDGELYKSMNECGRYLRNE
jgi:hypothetical protein